MDSFEKGNYLKYFHQRLGGGGGLFEGATELLHSKIANFIPNEALPNTTLSL